MIVLLSSFFCLEFSFERTFVQKMCMQNVDEIDPRSLVFIVLPNKFVFEVKTWLVRFMRFISRICFCAELTSCNQRLSNSSKKLGRFISYMNYFYLSNALAFWYQCHKSWYLQVSSFRRSISQSQNDGHVTAGISYITFFARIPKS